MNVPETMNEVLDMSDDEGIKNFLTNFFTLCGCNKCLFRKPPTNTHY